MSEAKTLVFATNNLHKLKELRQMVGDRITILSLKDINCFDEIPEDFSTLEENAVQKAKFVKEKYGFDCFADDTGLEVDSLGGAPGVRSARYAGEEHDSKANMNLLLRNMEGKTDRKARFRTVIALIQGEEIKLFEGKVEGNIMEKPSGDSGFGYDPIFQPLGWNRTFAEVSEKEKNEISHRGMAVKNLIEYLIK